MKCPYPLHAAALMVLLWIPTNGKSQLTPTDDYPNYGIFQYFVPFETSQKINAASPYLESTTYQSGKIITKSNEEIVPNKIRYNILTEEIECEIKNQHCRISTPWNVSKVKIKNDLYEYKKYISKGDSVKGFLLNICKASKNLYAKISLKHSNSKKQKAELKTVFMLEEMGRLPRKIQSIRSEFYSIFPGTQSQANDYMTRNNYSWDNPSDLAQLVDYLQNRKVDNVASR